MKSILPEHHSVTEIPWRDDQDQNRLRKIKTPTRLTLFCQEINM